MKWKDLKRYEGFYQISEYGDIKSLALPGPGNRNYDKILYINDIKESGQGRYKHIRIVDKKSELGTDKRRKRNNEMIHRLVYETFIGDIKEGYVIDHIDNDRNNNHYSNLQMIKQTQNIKKYYNENYYKDKIFEDGKICTKCNKKKPFSDFYKRKSNTINKWSPRCKYCLKKLN
jgi:hypothetical protein